MMTMMSDPQPQALAARLFIHIVHSNAMMVNPMYTAMTMKQFAEAADICSCVGEPLPTTGWYHSPTYLACKGCMALHAEGQEENHRHSRIIRLDANPNDAHEYRPKYAHASTKAAS